MSDKHGSNTLRAIQAAVGVKRLGSKVLDQVASGDTRLALKLDIIAGALLGLHMGAYYPFLGKIARDNLHSSVLMISLLAAAPCIGPLLAPFWAQKMTGLNKMPFVVWSGSVARVLLVLMALVTNAWAFVMLVSLSQIIGGIGSPAYSTLMKEIYPDNIRGRCMGIVRVGIQATTFLVALVAGRLLDLDRYAFHWVFPVAGVLGVVSSQVFGRIHVVPIDMGTDYKPKTLDSFRVLKENPNYCRFAIAVFIFGIGNLIAGPAMTIHQVDNLHIRSEYIAYLVNASALTAVPFYFIWGRFLDGRGPLRTVWISMLISAMVPIVYLFAVDWRLLLAASIMGGISSSGIELSYLNSILHFAENDRIPQYQSIHFFLFGIRGTIAPFLGGALIEFSNSALRPLEWHGSTYLAPVFIISIFLIATGALLQALNYRLSADLKVRQQAR